MRRYAGAVLLVLISAGLLYTAFRPQPVDVDLAVVARGPLKVTVDEDGKTRIKEKYVVSSPLAGRLLRIDMEPGDKVDHGESLLATLQPRDPTLLDARELASAEARVKAQETALLRARPDLEKARTALELAESEMARTRELSRERALSRQELDRAVANYRQRREEYRAARFSETIAEYELDLARAALLTTDPDSDALNDAVQFPMYSPIILSVS